MGPIHSLVEKDISYGEGRRMKEEGRRKKEEGRRKKEEGREWEWEEITTHVVKTLDFNLFGFA
jgi:hypothetical protein